MRRRVTWLILLLGAIYILTLIGFILADFLLPQFVAPMRALVLFVLILVPFVLMGLAVLVTHGREKDLTARQEKLCQVIEKILPIASGVLVAYFVITLFRG